MTEFPDARYSMLIQEIGRLSDRGVNCGKPKREKIDDRLGKAE